MVMNITGWKDGKVTATSPIFGEASFDAEVFQSIDFTGKNTRQASNISPTIKPVLIEKDVRRNLQLLGRGGLPAPRLEKVPQIKPRR
jgi:hypothetical protein